MPQGGFGKGIALACGFAAARGDIIVMLDADGSTDPAEIPRFLAPLRDGADFVKGSRFIDGGESLDITRLRRAGNRVLGGLVNLMYGTCIPTCCYGYNAFWARCLPHMQVDCAGFEVETLITVRAARAALQVREVPSVEAERRHGSATVRAFRDGRRVLYTILVERFGRRRNPHDDWRLAFLELEAKSARAPGHVAHRRGLSRPPAERPAGVQS